MRGYQSLGVRSNIAKFISMVLILGAFGFVGFVIFFYVAPVESLTVWEPEQPIPYSHKLHAGDLEINCQYCHSYARRSEMAGIPSLAKCMNCHDNLSVETEPIKILRKHFEDRTPIEWVRIYDLPDHVWFSHKRHLAKDVSCQKCHGPVETLEVNARLITHHMGFCLNCHQANNAPTDCWTCHQ